MSEWQTASERLNRFVSLDPRLRKELTSLSMAQARDDKIAFRLEEGRIYGLRQQFYENRLARELARKLQVTPITEAHW